MSEGLVAGVISTGPEAIGSIAGAAGDEPLGASWAATRCDTGDPDFAEQLGAFLAAENLIERAALDRARRAARTTGERFDQVVTKLGLISETDLALALSKYLAIPIAKSADVSPEPVLPDLIDVDFIRRNRIMPLSLASGCLTIGVTDPFNEEPVRAIAYGGMRDLILA